MEDPLLAHISKVSARGGKYDDCGEYDEAYIQPQQQHQQHQYEDEEEENVDYGYEEVQEEDEEIITMPRPIK